MNKTKKLSLFVFLDAFGWEILKQHQFLDDILVTKSPLHTVFGYSSTCDPTILTGKMPSDHGHFSFFAYNPEKSPFGLCRVLNILPKSITRRGRVRRVMSRVIQRFYGYTGYFQIYNMPFNYISLFDYTEKKDLYQAGGINYGVPTIFDHLRNNNIPFYLSDWRLKEEDNLNSVKTAINEGNVSFAYLYMAAMDAILHADGTSAPSVANKIQWYDARIRELITLAEKNYDKLNLFIFSDHGMTNTTDTCDLISRINRLGLKFGKDYAAMYDSTMARFWFLNDSAKQKIINALKTEPKGRILSEGELNAYGCNFERKEYGELFFLMNPGVLLCPSFMGETRLAGMHGYDPHHKDSVAMFSSNIIPDPVPRRLDNLYNLMLREVSENNTEVKKHEKDETLHHYAFA